MMVEDLSQVRDEQLTFVVSGNFEQAEINLEAR